jgi:rhamnosyltransferase
MTRVLVILGLYNGRHWIEEQVESIINQSSVDVTILVGDDSSSDDSVGFIERRFFEDAIEIIRFPTRSGGAGQNFLRLLAGVDVSSYDYVAFSDQDDIWLPCKLKRAADKLMDSSSVGYSASVEAFWPDGKKRLLTQNHGITDLDFLFEGAGQGCSFVLKKNFVIEVQEILRRPDISFGSLHYHDWTVYALSRVLGCSWIFDSEPSLLYRQHDENDTGARGAIAGVKKRLSLISNGWYRGQVGLVAEVACAVGGANVLPGDFTRIFWGRKGLKRRLILAQILFIRGRRRRSDRLILAISALLGWI